jgi:hypothetical protein
LQAVRYVIVLAAGFLAGSRLVEALRAWQEWHRWSASDPSAADGYRTFFLISAAISALSLAVAVLVWWLLRPAGDSHRP